MAGADFLNIPGNIRQIYLPFTIAGPGKLQVFSFKNNREGPAVAQIHPFPKTFEQLFLADSGFQYSHGPKGSNKIEYKDFLDNIPSFQIREFVPDARLTQTFKWFTYFKRGADAAVSGIDFESFNWSKAKEIVGEAMDALSEKMRELTSGDAKLLGDVAAGMTHYYRDKGFNFGGDAGFAVLWVPFLLYYRLTTTHTNTIYELPYSSTDPIMTSDGTYGWQTESYSLMEMLGDVGNSGIGQLFAKGFGSTIKVNVMPSFDPTRNGGVTAGSTITVTLDLINDSAEAACNNFLFCHTLFGNNRWLQYGFVQASGSLYDVKLPGANRYFMCTGKFRCESRGAFRSPSDLVIACICNHINAGTSFGQALEKLVDSSDKATEIRKNMADGYAESEMRRIARQHPASNASGLLKKRASPSFSYNQFAESAGRALRFGTIPSNGSTLQVPSTVREYEIKPQSLSDEDIMTSRNFSNWTDAIKNNNNTIAANERQIARNNAKITEIRNSDEYKSALFNHGFTEAELTTCQENFDVAKSNLEDFSGDINSEEYRELQTAYGNAYTALESARAAFDLADNNLTQFNSEISELEENNESMRNDSKTRSDANDNYEKQLNSNSDIADLRKRLADSYDQSINSSMGSGSFESVQESIKDLIKIPDVYHITMEFGSLIPDNFNTYLYGFREANLDMFKDYAAGNVDETGVFEKLADKLTEALGGK